MKMRVTDAEIRSKLFLLHDDVHEFNLQDLDYAYTSRIDFVVGHVDQHVAKIMYSRKIFPCIYDPIMFVGQGNNMWSSVTPADYLLLLMFQY